MAKLYCDVLLDVLHDVVSYKQLIILDFPNVQEDGQFSETHSESICSITIMSAVHEVEFKNSTY